MDTSQSSNGTAIHSPSTRHSAEPFKKARLFDLRNSPPASRNTSGLNPSASPFHSFLNFNTAIPFFEPDYPSQRFRPETYEEEDPNDPYYSPPPTFMPPESPNSIEGDRSSRGPSAGSRVREFIHSSKFSSLTPDIVDRTIFIIQRLYRGDSNSWTAQQSRYIRNLWPICFVESDQFYSYTTS